MLVDRHLAQDTSESAFGRADSCIFRLALGNPAEEFAKFITKQNNTT